MAPMASGKRPFCGRAADVAPDRGYFRPQNTSLKPVVSTILIDIFGQERTYHGAPTAAHGRRTTAVFRHPGRPRRTGAAIHLHPVLPGSRGGTPRCRAAGEIPDAVASRSVHTRRQHADDPIEPATEPQAGFFFLMIPRPP